MFSKTILRDSVSLDGSLTNSYSNTELHYQIAEKYNADAYLTGSMRAHKLKLGKTKSLEKNH